MPQKKRGGGARSLSLLPNKTIPKIEYDNIKKPIHIDSLSTRRESSKVLKDDYRNGEGEQRFRRWATRLRNGGPNTGHAQ